MRDVVSHMTWGAGPQGGRESLAMLLTKICDQSKLSRHDMKETAVWIVARSTARSNSVFGLTSAHPLCFPPSQQPHYSWPDETDGSQETPESHTCEHTLGLLALVDRLIPGKDRPDNRGGRDEGLQTLTVVGDEPGCWRARGQDGRPEDHPTQAASALTRCPREHEWSSLIGVQAEGDALDNLQGMERTSPNACSVLCWSATPPTPTRRWKASVSPLATSSAHSLFHRQDLPLCRTPTVRLLTMTRMRDKAPAKSRHF